MSQCCLRVQIMYDGDTLWELPAYLGEYQNIPTDLEGVSNYQQIGGEYYLSDTSEDWWWSVRKPDIILR